MMDCKRCRVAFGERGWTAQTERGEAGPYATEDIAMRVAVAEVMRLRRAGEAARLAIRSQRGDMRDICLCALVDRPAAMDA
jgi:hypothetical protein